MFSTSRWETDFIYGCFVFCVVGREKPESRSSMEGRRGLLLSLIMAACFYGNAAQMTGGYDNADHDWTSCIPAHKGSQQTGLYNITSTVVWKKNCCGSKIAPNINVLPVNKEVSPKLIMVIQKKALSIFFWLAHNSGYPPLLSVNHHAATVHHCLARCLSTKICSSGKSFPRSTLWPPHDFTTFFLSLHSRRHRRHRLLGRRVLEHRHWELRADPSSSCSIPIRTRKTSSSTSTDSLTWGVAPTRANALTSCWMSTLWRRQEAGLARMCRRSPWWSLMANLKTTWSPTPRIWRGKELLCMQSVSKMQMKRSWKRLRMRCTVSASKVCRTPQRCREFLRASSRCFAQL